MTGEGSIEDVIAGRARWAVVCGDCLDVLPTIASRVDAAVFDPPYGIAHASNWAGPFRARPVANDDDTAVRDAALAVLKCPSIVFGSWKRQAPVGVRETLVWDKGPASGMGDLALPWKRSWECIYVIGEGFMGTRDEGVLRGHTVVTWASKGREHPNEKPVSLMSALIVKCPGVVVVDPFSGSGATGVAALRLGRRVILIDVAHEWAELSRDRLRAEESGSTLQAARAGQVPLFAKVGT